jgi:hypothetical protein
LQAQIVISYLFVAYSGGTEATVVAHGKTFWQYLDLK